METTFADTISRKSVHPGAADEFQAVFVKQREIDLLELYNLKQSISAI
jgi:hypothetical protein